MKMIILGAGQVGASLAENLVTENHDITIVDEQADCLNELQERLDLRTVVGRPSYPDILRQAGADNADMVIAVTGSDEVNMIACQVAYSLFNVPTKIARIRSPHYFIRKDLFSKENLPVDVFISPEQLITDYVKQLVVYPGALQVLNFAEGKIKMVAIKPYYGGIMLGKRVGQLKEHFPDVWIRIVAIFRNDHSIPVDKDTTFEIGDEVFFVTTDEHVVSVMSAMRRVAEPYKRIMIAGGGNIGARLAASLSENYQVKVIDHNKERCEQLADELDNVMILNASSSDRQLLSDENIESTDIFCAVTNDDEDNIISCLLAKRLGAKQVMALITQTTYVDLIEGGPINIAISPQQATVGSILTHARRGDVVNVYSLRRGAAEAIEVVAHGDKKTSKVVGRSPKDIHLPKGTMMAAIVRNGEFIMPTRHAAIESGDHVILFVANKKHLRDVEKLFQVSAGFF